MKETQEVVKARKYVQTLLRQWGAGNVPLLMFASKKVNNAGALFL